MHRATARFWTLLAHLPESIQNVAHQNFELENPSHPSLHFRKIGIFWSARVGINYRASLWRTVRTSFGSGSDLTMIISE
jgi:hypothetical protein